MAKDTIDFTIQLQHNRLAKFREARCFCITADGSLELYRESYIPEGVIATGEWVYIARSYDDGEREMSAF